MRSFLTLISNPARMCRDGWAGAKAKIFVPFHGFIMFNGSELSFPDATIKQSDSRFLAGTVQEGLYKKEGGICNGLV